MNLIELLKSALPPNQVEAAKLLNITQPAIHKWMSGKGKPSPKSAKAIEKATGGKIKCHQIRPDIFDAETETSQRSTPPGEAAQA